MTTNLPPEVQQELLDCLANGGNVRAFCREPGRPKKTSIYTLVAKDADFAAAFKRARYCGAADKMEEALEMARLPLPGDVITIEEEVDKETGEMHTVRRAVKREDMLGHRKLVVETLMKQAACYDPENFGSRNYMEHSGRLSLEQLVCKSFDAEAPPLDGTASPS